MIFRTPIAALGLMIAFSASAGVFKDDTDRFTGVRAVSWSSLPPQATEFALSTTALYTKGQSEPYYQLQLLTWASEWRFMDCHHTNWLVDGVPDPYLELAYSHDLAGSATIERFDKAVDRPNLQRLAAAKLIEFKVCGTEGKISSGDMEGMRKVLAATK